MAQLVLPCFLEPHQLMNALWQRRHTACDFAAALADLWTKPKASELYGDGDVTHHTQCVTPSR